MATLKESLNIIHQIVNVEENICTNNILLASLQSKSKNCKCSGEIETCFTEGSCANCHRQGMCY